MRMHGLSGRILDFLRWRFGGVTPELILTPGEQDEYRRRAGRRGVGSICGTH